MEWYNVISDGMEKGELIDNDIVVINVDSNKAFRLRSALINTKSSINIPSPYIYSEPATTRYLAIEGADRMKVLSEMLDEGTKYKLGNYKGIDTDKNIHVTDCIDATYRKEEIIRFFF